MVVAEQWVASGLAALGVATVALWSALFAGLWGQWPRRMEWVALGGETITAAEWAAMPVILAGVAIVMVGHSRAAASAAAPDRHGTVSS